MLKNRDETGVIWQTGPLRLRFAWGPASAVSLTGWELPGAHWEDARWRTTQPLIELLQRGVGRAWNNTRLLGTEVGAELRYVGHECDATQLRIVQEIPQRWRVTTTFQSSGTEAAVQVTSAAQNLAEERVEIEALSSVAFGALIAPGESESDLRLHRGQSQQLAEFRWSSEPLRSNRGLADTHSFAHANQCGRGVIGETGHSTWSTDGPLPAGIISNDATGRAVMWQIEHNGGWRWEIADRRWGPDAFALITSGPTDLHHDCSIALESGQSFETVPASLAFSASDDVVAVMTRHRRWLRSRFRRPDSLVVYNDYMNTLDGEPSEAADTPLAEAAAEVGAEVFCIDAGWYADADVPWWPAIGDWRPSDGRFPSGLGTLIERIRQLGMLPGIWLEPEQVGVTSVAGRELPDGAFLSRHGYRVREHDRWFLDLRHPAARDHLDERMRVLIEDLGIGYFKFDYNVTPGSGTDSDGLSAGAGLLGHSRAYLEWFGQLRLRHPGVTFENCASGAMRADFAQLARFDLQSTSDQQEPLLYPPIAAGAPMMMPPEVAANWAYPQPRMSPEEIAFTMVTGMAGRLYLAGFLDGMSREQRALVAAGVEVHKLMRVDLASSVATWPDGLPRWDEPVVTLVLQGRQWSYLYVWSRSPGVGVTLPLGVEASQLETLYPRNLPAWSLCDDIDGAVALLPPSGAATLTGPSARVFRFPTPPASGAEQ